MSTIVGGRARPLEGSGGPSSGTSGSGVGEAHPGHLYVDTSTGVVYVNEGTLTAPYWSPISLDQVPMWGVHSDWRDQAGAAVANTDAETIIPGSGIRVFGQGKAENDSGAVAQAAAEGGIVLRMTTTNEDAHVIAIGMDAGIMQPDAHGLLVVEAELTAVSAITNKALFIGFLGTAADALDPAVTGATTVATLVQDDLAGLWMDAGLTDADAFFGVHNKSNEAATQDLTADGDTGPTNLAAAGTYQRLRVEIGPVSSGAVPMRCFVDKTQVYTFADALDEDEECSPVLYLESLTTATQSIDVRRFAAWAARV